MTVADTHDLDPEETREWLDALSSVQGHRGNERAEFVVNAIVDAARGAGLSVQRQRQDRSRARKRFPRRRLKRHQGPVGLRLGSLAGEGQERVAAEAHGGMRRRRVSGF
jgi:hypothetical protein